MFFLQRFTRRKLIGNFALVSPPGGSVREKGNGGIVVRLGQNPAKFVKSVAKPARITVAVLNYNPSTNEGVMVFNPDQAATEE